MHRPDLDRARPGRRLAVALAALVGVLAPQGPAGAQEAPDATLTVDGTAVTVVVEAPGASGASTTDSLVEVDGTLYDLPDALAGDVVTGEDLTVTLTADAGLDDAAALDAATSGDPTATATARIVEVAPADGVAADTGATAEVGLGGHSLLVLPVHFGSQPAEDLTATARDSAQYWVEQSNGSIAMSWQVRPEWKTVAAPTSCDMAAMTTLYNAALAAHGVAAPGAGEHVAVYFPDVAACSWAGMASVGGGRVWVNGANVVDVLAHELGHNLGLGHANAMRCMTGGVRVPLAAATSCSRAEYADAADVMGYATGAVTGSLNTALADLLGLVALTDAGAVPAGTSLTLHPLTSVTAHRALRISAPEGTIYVDFRPADPAGRDRRQTLLGLAWAGVQVHLRPAYSNDSYLLDMQPTTVSAFARPNLPAGARWTVPSTGTTVTVTGTGATAQVVVSVPTDPLASYVTRVYRDLFDRAVDPTGLAGWTTALRTGTPRVAVANAITYSDEYRLGLVAGAYRTYLDRLPDEAGHRAWLGEMQRGLTIQELEGQFLASDEYYAQAGGTDAGWVRRMYLHVLHREPGAAEVAAWTGELARGAVSRYGASMGFMLSTEHLTDVVDGYYQALLGRSIDPAGASGWVTAIQQGTRVETIIGGIVSSEEYYSRG